MDGAGLAENGDFVYEIVRAEGTERVGAAVVLLISHL